MRNAVHVKINKRQLHNDVVKTLAEDIGKGELFKLKYSTVKKAVLTANQGAIICGIPWFEECFRQLDRHSTFNWLVSEGQQVPAPGEIAVITADANAMLTAERSALNFLQLLSSVATSTNFLVTLIENEKTKLYDSRKTIPRLRHAQKYAVSVGGGYPNRWGLYDQLLIKENNIACFSSLGQLAKELKELGSKKIKGCQIEVQNQDQMIEAINLGFTSIMLDNFTHNQIKKAISYRDKLDKPIELEASGNITHKNISQIAHTGVERISSGSITKHIQAVDYSIRIE